MKVTYKNNNKGIKIEYTFEKDNENHKKQKKKNSTQNIKDINIEEKNEKTKSPKKENIINISLISSGKEKRTFVRLHPIPKKLSVYDMIRIIDKYLKTEPGKRKYNAVYLPITKKIGINMGFLFINFVNPKYVIDFYNTFEGFEFKKCKKKCSVIFSDNQNIDLSNEDPTRNPIVFNDTIKDDVLFENPKINFF